MLDSGFRRNDGFMRFSEFFNNLLTELFVAKTQRKSKLMRIGFNN